MCRENSQRQQVQKWLNDGNSITPLQALQMFGAFRLSSIIYRLKYDYGMNIKTEIINDNGKRYAEYSLV